MSRMKVRTTVSLFAASLLGMSAAHAEVAESNVDADELDVIEEISVVIERRPLIVEPELDEIDIAQQTRELIESWEQETLANEAVDSTDEAGDSLRIGYSPEDDERSSSDYGTERLPLDLVVPAPVITIDF